MATGSKSATPPGASAGSNKETLRKSPDPPLSRQIVGQSGGSSRFPPRTKPFFALKPLRLYHVRKDVNTYKQQTLLAGIICLAFSLPCFGQAPPPNDDFSNRTLLIGNSVAFSGTLAGSTLEPQEPVGSLLKPYLEDSMSQSIWWTWTAPQTSLVTVEMIGASADGTVDDGFPLDGIAIYDTTNVFTPVEPVAEGDLDVSILCEAWTFSAIGGSNYQIQVLGSSSIAYQFLLMATNSPLILQPPLSVTVAFNASTLFSVVAEGYRPLSYQWQFGGTNLAGQTAPMLPLTNIETSQAGSYWVIITNAGGAVTSAPVVLAVSTSNTRPALTATNGEPGRFMLTLTGEVGRNYRIDSSVDLAGWTNEDSFPRYPYSFISDPQFQNDNSLFTSIVFNTNGASTFAISNSAAAKFLRASQYQPANEICINNLREIRFAKSLWVRDYEEGYIYADYLPDRGLTPQGSNLASYFPQSALPCCPVDQAQMFQTSYITGEC